MGRDSNPRDACTSAGFQDRCLKPLGHPSIAFRNKDLPVYRKFQKKSMLPKLLPKPFISRFQVPHGGSKSLVELSAASSCIVLVTWEYRSIVVLMVECPRRSCATLGCTPASKSYA